MVDVEPRIVRTPGGRDMPYFVIPFDKKGRCEGPRTRARLLEWLADPATAPTHVFLFSHGWNNDWTVATRRYERFMNGYLRMAAEKPLEHPANFKPLLVGIFWPSTALVFGEGEAGPDIAGAGDEAGQQARDEEEQSRKEFLRLAADRVPTAQVDRLYELLDAESLDEAEGRELLDIIAPMLETESPDEVEEPGGSEAMLVNWAAVSEEPEEAVDVTAIGDFAVEDDEGPGAAFDLGGIKKKLNKLDPRQLVRLLTVRQMKDRAGTVGTNGVGPLLQDILAAAPAARVIVAGHSYGAKVVMSAVCAGPDLPRQVYGALLLQPAISHLAFAEDVKGRPGGYRPALARVQKPILATFSANDQALRTFFHHGLSRDEDLAEAKIAGSDDPPSPFAALGGYGPRQSGEIIVDILDFPTRYDLPDTAELYGIRGTTRISGHGDISNEATYWALYCLVTS